MRDVRYSGTVCDFGGEFVSRKPETEVMSSSLPLR